MRPLLQMVAERFGKTRVCFLALLTAGAWTLGCGGGGTVAPPPPPPCIAVSGIAGGNASVGTISSAGVYIAPEELRVLYTDPADTLHQGSITGRIIPASPFALPAFPPGVTGAFGADVVGIDNSTGAVVVPNRGTPHRGPVRNRSRGSFLPFSSRYSRLQA